MKEIVWQPKGIYACGYEFGVLVDREFIEQAMSLQMNPEKQQNMIRLGRETIKRQGYDSGTPFNFEGETYLVRQFDIGSNGKWLTLDGCSGENPLLIFKEGPIKYSSHNCDYSSDVHALMSLVDLWVEYLDIVKEP